MKPIEEMAATYSGRELAHANVFKFMRIALANTVGAPAPPGGPSHAQMFRQSLAAFRGSHLAIPPGLPLSEPERQVAQAAYREKFDELCTKLLDGLPEGA